MIVSLCEGRSRFSDDNNCICYDIGWSDKVWKKTKDGYKHVKTGQLRLFSEDGVRYGPPAGSMIWSESRSKLCKAILVDLKERLRIAEANTQYHRDVLSLFVSQYASAKKKAKKKVSKKGKKKR